MKSKPSYFQLFTFPPTRAKRLGTIKGGYSSSLDRKAALSISDLLFFHCNPKTRSQASYGDTLALKKYLSERMRYMKEEK